jgi:hypothetical protein
MAEGVSSLHDAPSKHVSLAPAESSRLRPRLRLTIPHLAGTSKMSKITTEGTEIVTVCQNMLFPAEVAADLQIAIHPLPPDLPAA